MGMGRAAAEWRWADPRGAVRLRRPGRHCAAAAQGQHCAAAAQGQHCECSRGTGTEPAPTCRANARAQHSLAGARVWPALAPRAAGTPRPRVVATRMRLPRIMRGPKAWRPLGERCGRAFARHVSAGVVRVSACVKRRGARVRREVGLVTLVRESGFDPRSAGGCVSGGFDPRSAGGCVSGGGDRRSAGGGLSGGGDRRVVDGPLVARLMKGGSRNGKLASGRCAIFQWARAGDRWLVRTGSEPSRSPLKMLGAALAGGHSRSACST
jgi:hypothetical protein